MTTLEFYRGDDGAPRAQGEDNSTLAQFLESDIQDDPDICAELLQRIKDYTSDQAQPLEFTGNSFNVSLSEAGVMFRCHASGESRITCLSVATVQRALQDWQKFID